MKTISYIILYPIAVILSVFIGLFGVIFAILKLRNIPNINGYFKSVDIIEDKKGNVTCQYLFDSTLITSNGYKFGNPNDVISYVIATNYKSNTLTLVGKVIGKTLIFLGDSQFTGISGLKYTDITTWVKNLF